MKLSFAVFCHSLLSDWNHGNAHFLRGIVSELKSRQHQVRVFEPEDGWSRENLLRDHGPEAIENFHRAFPALTSEDYRLENLDLEQALDGVDIAIVHEWNDPALIAAIGKYRSKNQQLRLFFHDTHHRASTAVDEFSRFTLNHYDAVLAYGASLRELYIEHGWSSQVFVWHEAADTRVFYPRPSQEQMQDLVWIGNWGDEERTDELREYFIHPCAELSLKATAFGVRYPATALDELAAAGILYKGWLPNFVAPEVFAQSKATIHVPRRPYTQHLPGIPTIRPFEALACGIPLVSAPWQDTENLFRVGQDFLMARNGDEMQARLREVIEDPELRSELARNGLETIRTRHTCGHRVDELLGIYQWIRHVSQTAPDSLAASGAMA